MDSSKLENDFVNSGLKRGTRYWDFTTKYTMGERVSDMQRVIVFSYCYSFSN
jgi:hypothetical protein